MSRVVSSPKAKSDLSDIWDYTLSEWGIDQAEKYVRELWAAMQNHACDPSISIDISDVRRGYRKARPGSHIIFFKRTSDGIDVVRILHRRMDFERHFSD
jgi:toxin ParE1/3/4